jgi:hypothetical protein
MAISHAKPYVDDDAGDDDDPYVAASDAGQGR